ncbi:two-component sensor histidine kinase [Cytobacillus depressus]|uniref:histidine kinase n=1 Tax=Cytobacillus depressus TaxID=1602942 RepID=A0A6L3VB44_9BACI|nr:ATP-binding protein [Cytobacillus depressus]KAB2336338.1 two-component sensor histidine kinase [Cytobacillus depressus]
MKKKNINSWLLREEKRALKVYLISFYITLVLYDFFYYYLFPKFILGMKPELDIPLVYWGYVILLGVLPVSFYLSRKGKQHSIKYLYIILYMAFAAFSDILQFTAESTEYRSGNAAELILILFSPIFINKRFFWVAFIASILRYLIVGVFIKSGAVVFPVALIIVLSVIAFIFLNRSYSFIRTLTNAYEELRHKEKLAFVGQMAASVGHEIKNPLASLKGFTQLQKEKYTSDQQYFSIMEQEIDRINSIVNDLLLLGKPRPSQFQKCDMKNNISYVISVTEQQASQKKIAFSIESDDQIPPIECDENQIKQVFMNLIKNGLDSMENGGEFRILLKLVADHKLSISFIDQGCGIPKSDLEKLFDPFYTTKQDGTGLGLLVSKKIVEDHQGEITVESKLNKGTKVEVILPIVQ